MNEGTNENYVEPYENNGGVPNPNIENAFSDLISEYFEGTPTENAGQVETYETIADIPATTTANDNGLFTNLAGNQQVDAQPQTDLLYKDLSGVSQTETTGSQVSGGELQTGGDTLADIITPVTALDESTGMGTTQTDEATTSTGTPSAQEGTEVIKNAYGVITISSEVMNNTTTPAMTSSGVPSSIVGEVEFKLTQANLPAKIGFWTKVRNFFLADSKFNYSVQEAQTNTGLWNKVQKFFSFGKNK